MLKIPILLCYLVSILITIGCSEAGEDSRQREVLGKWRLIETLSDPGDGSGVYVHVVSDKVVEFERGGKFTSNDNLCPSQNGITDAYTGIYDPSDSTITPDKCQSDGFYYFVKGENLYLTFRCIEACGQKFEKVVENTTHQ